MKLGLRVSGKDNDLAWPKLVQPAWPQAALHKNSQKEGVGVEGGGGLCLGQRAICTPIGTALRSGITSSKGRGPCHLPPGVTFK